jgi:transglutaminase-like putative cysteine protease
VSTARYPAHGGRPRSRASWGGSGKDEPADGRLVPIWVARLIGLATLGSLGALEWQRQVAGYPAGQALLWVVAALAAGGAVVASDRLAGTRRTVAVLGAAFGGVVLATLLSGAPARLVLPVHWGELVSTVFEGIRSTGTVRLPYDALQPGPRIALEVLGAWLVLAAALLALWPRAGRGERGFPFIALALLLVLVVSPVVALGGTTSAVLGVALAGLCMVFLWLERLPLRPGLGLAALVGVALAGALPLAATADRGAPWFDYKAFSEAIGPNDPVNFRWNQTYGPVDWPRDGNEVLRVKSPKPLYWKAENLERFNGREWVARSPNATSETHDTEVPEDWRNRPAWTNTIQVEIRRMRSPDLIAAGTTMAVRDASRTVVPSGRPGTYRVPGDLHRGDSYTATVHVPEPPAAALSEANSGERGQQADDLLVHVPFPRGKSLSRHAVGRGGHGRIRYAVIHFRSFGDQRDAYAEYPQANTSSFDVAKVMRRSEYARTYRLAMRLRHRAKTPLQYVLEVNRYLQQGFTYSERPAPVPAGRAPLDGFLFDTKEGYCQHFSGAMALLLRMGGVPARVATGFSPGGYSTRYKAWIVRDTDAHAWVEAWYDSAGWVTYDPTPSTTPARSQIFALQDLPQVTDNGGAAADAAGAGGGGVSDAARRGVGVRADLLHDPLAGATTRTPGGAAIDQGTPWWQWALGGVVVLLLAGVGVLAFLRRRQLRGLSGSERALVELEAALRRAGRPQPTGTTLRQLERVLGTSPDAVGYLRALSAARYGPTPAPPTRAQRRGLRRALAAGLGVRGVVRAWWALPPQRGR